LFSTETTSLKNSKKSENVKRFGGKKSQRRFEAGFHF